MCRRSVPGVDHPVRTAREAGSVEGGPLPPFGLPWLQAQSGSKVAGCVYSGDPLLPRSTPQS